MMRRMIFLALILLTCLASSYSQDNCRCTDYFVLKKKNLSDSLIADHLIQQKNLVCKAKGHEMLGSILIDATDLDSAEVMLKQGELFYKKSGCSDTFFLLNYKLRAQIYYTRADFVNAQVYSLKLTECAEKAGNFFELAASYTMTAQLFNQTGQANLGINYTRKAAKLLTKLNEGDQIKLLPFLCHRYLWHFQDTGEKSSLDSTEIFSRLYLSKAKKLNDHYKIYRAYTLIQGVAYEKGDFAKALRLTDSMYVFIDKGNSASMQLYYSDKADLMIEIKELDKAQIYADSALNHALINHNPAYIAEIYMLMEKISSQKGDFKHAYEMSKRTLMISDSIRNVEKSEAVTELEKKYNQAKNENIIKDLDKKNQLYLLLAIAGLFALLALGFYLRQQKLKHQQDILETEQRLNRARMNPHFFFNALATLQKFALRDNDGHALASNLSKFSNIMRETLESTYKEYITIEQEMDFLNEYLEVQKIRFPNTFSYNIFVQPEMEVDDILIPSMILQPFVENSIEHGFSGIDYPGHVDIGFSIVNKELMIEVSDNGKGLHAKAKENNDHISRAGQIIKDRIYLLNIKLKTKAGFSIDNNMDGRGTIVKIHLPLLFQSNQT